jgi:hypothetical protein
MWEQYKKRFWGMQLFIALIVVGSYRLSGLWGPSVMFFVTMQAGAFLGAAWAHRLKRKIQGPSW